MKTVRLSGKLRGKLAFSLLLSALLPWSSAAAGPAPASYDQIAGTLQDSELLAAEPKTDVTAVEDSFSISASDFPAQTENVAFCLISPSGSQLWIQAQLQNNAAWTASIEPIPTFGEWGSYRVQTWATIQGVTDLHGETEAALRNGEIHLETKQSENGALITASGWTTSPENAAFEVVSPSGSSRWYQAVRSVDGAWSADAPILTDFRQTGTYAISLWATYGPKTLKYASGTFATRQDTAEISVTRENNKVSLNAGNWSREPGNVAFCVTSPSGVQRWYQANGGKLANWSAAIDPVADFGSWGTYRVEAWATIGPLTQPVGTATFAMQRPVATMTSSISSDRLSLRTSGWSSVPNNVAYEMKGPSGTSRWYQAYRQADDSWTAETILDGSLGWGTLQIVAWATFGPSTDSYATASQLYEPVSISYRLRLTSGGIASGSDGSQASTWDGSAVRGSNALAVSVEKSPVSGSISVSALSSSGWSAPSSNGAFTGGTGAVSAVRISPTGALASYCDIWYRVYAGSYGWLGWTSNGNTAGTSDMDTGLDAIEIVAVPKGSAAPGSTDGPYLWSHVASILNSVQWKGARHYSSGRLGNNWQAIVIHISECTSLRQIDDTFQGTREASAHYGVGPGEIHQYVSLNDTAWAVGNWPWNLKTVSIEHVGTTANPPSRAALDTSAQLMAALAMQKGWTELVMGENVGIHKWYGATACPATLDVRYLVSKANEYLGNGFTYKSVANGGATPQSTPRISGSLLQSLTALDGHGRGF